MAENINERKIVIEKKHKTKNRTMVEIDNDIHEQILELSFKTGKSVREIVSMLLADALQYVEVEE